MGKEENEEGRKQVRKWERREEGKKMGKWGRKEGSKKMWKKEESKKTEMEGRR
jgi:hypothetical protein